MHASLEPVAKCRRHYQHQEIVGHPFYVFFDHQRRWLKYSEELAEFLGYGVTELVGQTADILLPKGFVYNIDGWEQFLSQGQITRFIPLTKKSGTIVGVWIEYLKLDDGCMVALLKL